METKLKFYNACVSSTLLHAAECWTLTERDEARLDAFDMRCQRKILRVIWSQHISNSCIRSKTKQPQLTSVIRKRRLQWFGHLQRMDGDRTPRGSIIGSQPMGNANLVVLRHHGETSSTETSQGWT
ncbi:uncharacterized protein [Amphiura filiformis]|uniref:uncharacterized protein n=1 Tax=Amphiura filiformis TaxID=82378 RepID=UPI003B212922